MAITPRWQSLAMAISEIAPLQKVLDSATLRYQDTRYLDTRYLDTKVFPVQI
ncbi:MAG: hypothetical protein WCI02_04925 [Planctomycetota bacterium]